MNQVKKVSLFFFLALFGCNSLNIKRYELGQIITPMGEMLVWLYDETPQHKVNFIERTQSNYWDSLTFNRVIKGFVIQGGCPDLPEGFGTSHFLLPPEFGIDLKHVYGALGAGRDNNPDKISAGCQFYIVQNKSGIARLDGDYTIFGQLIEGFDVLEKIATTPTDSLDTPINRIKMDVNIVLFTAEELKKKGFVIPEKSK